MALTQPPFPPSLAAGDIIDGKYVQHQQGIRNITMIGQRLYSGRVVISESCLIFARSLLTETKAYADQKMCWGPGENAQLSSIPQLGSLFQEADQRLSRLEGFIYAVQDKLAVHLKQATMPDNGLVEAIAAGKVLCVETAIDICHRLRQEVGSFALMAGSGFERTGEVESCGGGGGGEALGLRVSWLVMEGMGMLLRLLLGGNVIPR